MAAARALRVQQIRGSSRRRSDQECMRRSRGQQSCGAAGAGRVERLCCLSCAVLSPGARATSGDAGLQMGAAYNSSRAGLAGE